MWSARRATEAGCGMRLIITPKPSWPLFLVEDEVFHRLKALLEPFGLTRYYTDYLLGCVHASPRPRRALPRQTSYAAYRVHASDVTDA
jgi:hypothetical protein